ncbi:MAG: MFS transporter [Turicibacter sp.]|nr:MFS transporter [Turicibacter sp.]
MKQQSLRKFLLFNFLTMTVFNFAHPVTPRLINELQLPSYMFGLFFALMSIGSYIFSPIWGSLSDYKGRKNFLMLGTFGYGVVQLGFGLSQHAALISIFRILGGILSVSYVAVIMACMSDLSSKENRAKSLAYLAATTSMGAAAGSNIGGWLGTVSYKHTFIVQFIACILLTIALYFFTSDTLEKKKEGKLEVALNHLKFKKSGLDFKSMLGGLILAVAFMNITTTSYNSTIGYFVESDLKLPTQLTGLVLSIAPIFAISVNFFISPRLAAKYDEFKTLITVIGITAVSLFIWAYSSNMIIMGIFLLIFLIVMPLAQPIYQSMISKHAQDNAGEIMGIQNSARSLGMVIGSLMAGFLYEFGSKLPFLVGSSTALIACLILLLQYYREKKTSA